MGFQYSSHKPDDPICTLFDRSLVILWFVIMASMSTLICVALLVVFCFILLKEPSGSNSRQYGWFIKASERHNRKVLAGLMQKKSGANISVFYDNKELNAWELRKAPSGPDPLHHNGNNPTKPRSP